jgi:hypothetical protein
MSGHGEKLSRRQEAVIAALLGEPTHAAAAAKAGIGEATLRRWMKLPRFSAAYRLARRDLVRGAIERLQASVGHAVDALSSVAQHGNKNSDRVRAAVAILNHAFLAPDLREGEPADSRRIEGTADVAHLLADRLRQLDAAELPAAEKARLTATLADAMLRAYGADVLDKRLEALQNVLGKREGMR